LIIIKMTKSFFVICFLSFIFLGCFAQDCPEGINKLPMYGNAKKCPAQIELDSSFVKYYDKVTGGRKQAAKRYVDIGWKYVYKHVTDTAIMRFNQAWLLDNNNPDIYWGFGNLLGMQQDFKQSVAMFDMAIQLNNHNARLYQDAALSYGNLFYQTKNKDFLDVSIKYLKSAVALDPNNAQAYAQLTMAYTYSMQKDSAKKYLNITDKINPNAVNPEVRKIISGN
jgi:tetratricopeptide (TPR) repeat protein